MHKKKLKIDDSLLNPKIGLAVSGGIDSMVMLDIFRKTKYQITVLHFNHKWRKEATKDASLVESYCLRHDIDYIYGEAPDNCVQSEDNARKLRYDFFSKVAEKQKLDLICTAHHIDDQFETVLYRLARGAGPQGLMPIKEFIKLNNSLLVARPLLWVTKDAIEEYARKNNIKYAVDKSNKDTKYKRNLLRLKVIPYLNKINNNARENILNSMHLIYCHSIVASNQYQKLLKKLSKKSNVWNRGKFLRLSFEEQYFLLYSFLNANNIKGSLAKISLLVDIINSKKSIDLDKVYRLECDNDEISLVKKKTGMTKNSKKLQKKFKLHLNKKEKLKINNSNYITLEPFTQQSFNKDFPGDKSKIAYVNLSALNGKVITIRNREKQDVFKPLGFSHVIRLKKYLINKKIPLQKRAKLPLVCKGKEILWIPGYSISDKIKVMTKPTTVLRLR